MATQSRFTQSKNQLKKATYKQFQGKAQALSKATKPLYNAEGDDAVAVATTAVEEARREYYNALDGESSSLKTNLNDLLPGVRYTDYAKDVCSKRRPSRKHAPDLGQRSRG